VPAQRDAGEPVPDNDETLLSAVPRHAVQLVSTGSEPVGGAVLGAPREQPLARVAIINTTVRGVTL
jgi:hypothetical protein